MMKIYQLHNITLGPESFIHKTRPCPEGPAGTQPRRCRARKALWAQQVFARNVNTLLFLHKQLALPQATLFLGSATPQIPDFKLFDGHLLQEAHSAHPTLKATLPHIHTCLLIHLNDHEAGPGPLRNPLSFPWCPAWWGCLLGP